MKYSQPLSKTKIGILGGGQLGWMMILEGKKYPFEFYVLGDKDNDPACKIADKCFSENEYKQMIDSCDVVTYEFEHVNDNALEYAEEKEKLLPRINSVELKRERYKEKEYLRNNGFPVPRFYVAEDGKEAIRILKDEFNNEGVIKTSKGGYDGKGQYFIHNDVEKYEFIKDMKCKFVVEEFVNFDFEASIIAVRSKTDFKYYTPSYNYNEKGILVYNYGPYNNDKMIEIAKELTDKLNYIGTIGIEFFVKDNKVMINEIAPRVHNTGHYTLDAASISQFEEHIRAISDLPLGSINILSFFGMVNILGTNNIPKEVLDYGKVYWYGKTEVRKRRKMGHVNIIGNDLEDVKQKIDNVIKLIYPEGYSL
ncbi:5-(carboxyamino)imidazole ribonucleotide synthase [Acidianus sulfidivorans JP7]|uniref:N5-carboxyaminoimidazole ribonucleotide synthase n=1 Tax=Acidianus sulfidivorans JP7 TaxID=619593 RepID=A0A2U9IMZ8_9CREN|nr:5-(carboxyamino)imidazole ribonucleotide synthase [Acidianus sulfidivorans]AWR97386.1 5-(carboxyamino)imidazole ribonucleotide synthase [Acidianus sulfidivorans JP7]